MIDPELAAFQNNDSSNSNDFQVFFNNTSIVLKIILKVESNDALQKIELFSMTHNLRCIPVLTMIDDKGTVVEAADSIQNVRVISPRVSRETATCAQTSKLFHGPFTHPVPQFSHNTLPAHVIRAYTS